MRFAAKDHQGKGVPFAKALTDAGHEMVPLHQRFDLLLTDYDIDLPHYRSCTTRAQALDAAILMYPHGAGVLTLWDGFEEPTELDCCVFAPGYKEAMEAYGYPNPIHVVGWPYSPITELTPREPHKVLFAPIHPAGSGHMHPEPQQHNAEVLAQLLKEGYEVTVRLYGKLQNHGLEPTDRVKWIFGDPSHVEGLEDADVVVANGTFAAEALARGIPTVSFDDQPHRWQFDNEFGERTKPVHWDDYWPIIRPDVAFGPGVVREIATNPELVRPWRDNFVGEEFDPEAFAQLAESINERTKCPSTA